MGLMRRLLHVIWGVSDPPVDLTPPIECDACVDARRAGRDACFEHHSHHTHSHPIGKAIDWDDPTRLN